MIDLQKTIARVKKVQHGFTDIKCAAEEFGTSETPASRLKLAKELFKSDVHQARMLAVYLFAGLAMKSSEALDLMRRRVSHDEDWRVQEILAQAFDRYCADIGYDKALPGIKSWLADPSPNVRRAASEGLRIWTSRPYFCDHPEAAIQCLSALRADQSEYVRRSVGNALRDISRNKHKDLVATELATWDLANKDILQTYNLASKFRELILSSFPRPRFHHLFAGSANRVGRHFRWLAVLPALGRSAVLRVVILRIAVHVPLMITLWFVRFGSALRLGLTLRHGGFLCLTRLFACRSTILFSWHSFSLCDKRIGSAISAHARKRNRDWAVTDSG